MKKLILTLALSLIFANASHAARNYGSAGCGLGSIVMGKQKGSSQVLAWTTNATSYTQLFGITSGTSNCVDDGAVKVAMQIPLFIEANRVSLANDAARGSGETLTTLSKLMGCENTKRFGTVLQTNYKTIFPTTTATDEQVTQAITNAVENDAFLKTDCNT